MTPLPNCWEIIDSIENIVLVQLKKNIVYHSIQFPFAFVMYLTIIFKKAKTNRMGSHQKNMVEWMKQFNPTFILN